MRSSVRQIKSRQFKLIGISIAAIVLGSLDAILVAKEIQSKDNKEVIVIHNKEIPLAEKEALIILPGLGDSKKGRNNQKLYFENVGYDLFIPDYIDKESFQATVKKFTQFFEDQKLNEYKKVHVFSYILGSWTINTFINNQGAQNISTIIYDRSPLQELAPRVISERIPRIGRMVSGDIIEDFSKINYPPIFNDEMHIGIIIESKATPLLRMFRKTVMSYGSIDWSNLDMSQSYDELIYTRLNHDEMYYSFDEIGEDILEFIKHSKFRATSRNIPFKWDPFEK
jgi:hypothetical protein